MLDFEENISDSYRRSNYQVLFVTENEAVISELTSSMASFSIGNVEDIIDFNVSTVFTLLLSFDQF